MGRWRRAAAAAAAAAVGELGGGDTLLLPAGGDDGELGEAGEDFRGSALAAARAGSWLSDPVLAVLSETALSVLLAGVCSEASLSSLTGEEVATLVDCKVSIVVQVHDGESWGVWLE